LEIESREGCSIPDYFVRLGKALLALIWSLLGTHMRNKSSSLHYKFEKMPGIGLSGLGGLIKSFGRNWNCRRRPEPFEPSLESRQPNVQESKNHINIKKEINVNRNMLQVNGKEMKGQEDNIAEVEESCKKEEGSRDKPACVTRGSISCTQA
jgi:hypothetical protein